MNKGRLISFEGLDGAGKTTQLALLEDWLRAQGIPFIRTREPGGTPLGKELRHLLVERPDLSIAPLAEAFLFQADRAQHYAELIEPTLATGTFVITDRSYDSSIAYQGAGGGVGVELVEHLSLIATSGRSPDLTILLDLDPEHVKTRTLGRGVRSRFDAQSERFHYRLREAFLALAQAHPERIKVISASQPATQIHQQIVALLESLLASNSLQSP